MTRRKRSDLRRKAFLTRAKGNGYVTPRRFKRLAEAMTLELTQELNVLLQLEQDVFQELQAKGVASEAWDHYAGFSKRVWKARVSFTDQTYAKELTSLVAEYTLRGLNAGILTQLEPIAVTWAYIKRGIPPYWILGVSRLGIETRLA